MQGDQVVVEVEAMTEVSRPPGERMCHHRLGNIDPRKGTNKHMKPKCVANSTVRIGVPTCQAVVDIAACYDDTCGLADCWTRISGRIGVVTDAKVAIVRGADRTDSAEVVAAEFVSNRRTVGRRSATCRWSAGHEGSGK